MSEPESITSQAAGNVSRLVVTAGAITGCVFGLLAGLAYGSTFVGGVVGIWSGAMAGVLWCRAMIPRLRRGDCRFAGSKGGAWGAFVGVLSTLLLHAVLALAIGQFDEDLLIIGVICGFISGFIVGDICARVLQVRMKPKSGESTGV